MSTLDASAASRGTSVQGPYVKPIGTLGDSVGACSAQLCKVGGENRGSDDGGRRHGGGSANGGRWEIDWLTCSKANGNGWWRTWRFGVTSSRWLRGVELAARYACPHYPARGLGISNLLYANDGTAPHSSLFRFDLNMSIAFRHADSNTAPPDLGTQHCISVPHVRGCTLYTVHRADGHPS
jgi:hypothetical protein